MQHEIESLTIESIEKEIARVNYNKKYRQVLKSTFFGLVVVASIAILISTTFLPIMHVYGVSMSPTFTDGDIIACIKKSDFKTGDTIAFYYNNKILVKRIVATSGEYVDIDKYGNVSIDDIPLEEPYLTEKALGECSIELPYQVPEGQFFVMGDNRKASADSRTEEIGCVFSEQIIGEIVIRVWPLDSFGLISD